ncbi:MAG TPA: MG2 domain-containing protein [Vicinamibacterales bacterium]|nr:MG2 domain-containing protein [Vicinamibacterales bacterium]
MTRISRFCTVALPLAGLLGAFMPASAQTLAGAQPAALTVVSAGPTGEVASLAEANEIRVVFSEPMVTLGRIPTPVRAPFFKVSPDIAGTFRWSGSTILVFTPDPARPLPFATRYDITLETTAAAVSGRRLAQPYTFSFVTPTVRLLQTNWYRRGGSAEAPVVALLRFNQRVREEDVAAHLRAAFEPHAWSEPALSEDAAARMNAADPTSVARFRAKAAATRAVAQARGPVEFRLTRDWDTKVFPPGPDLVVLESVTAIPSESWIRLTLDERLPSPAGNAVPGKQQNYTVQVERAFFIDGFDCRLQCDPDRRNPIELRGEVRVSDFAAAIGVNDVTASAAPQEVSRPATPRARQPYDLNEMDVSRYLTIEDAGFESQPPARTYAVTVSRDLRSIDGQVLGYTWVGTAANWHQRAFTSFGDGHGVWETGGGAVLPFYARNLQNVRQWAAPIAPGELMPTLLKLQPRFNLTPEGDGIERRLGGAPDRIQSHGLDMSGALGGAATGLVWAAVGEGEPIEESRPYGKARVRASVVQITNLGITVKDSPQNTLVFVTRLDTGAPVEGAKVSIVRLDNKVFWTGTTGADGVAIAPDTPLRPDGEWWRFAFVLTAEKDGDVAYAGSDWHEGVNPWDFGMRLDLRESPGLLRGSVFSDRGVYRLGEEVHIKAILRHNTAAGIRLLAEGTPVFASLRDSQDRAVDERTVKVGAWSSAEWKVMLPADGALGHYSLRVMLESDRPKPKAPEDLKPGQTPGPRTDRQVPYTRVVNGSFLVAAYRRPDFRVDVTLTGAQPIAGGELRGQITARYLFGAQMGARPLRWSYTSSPVYGAPAAVREAFPEDRWHFVGWSDRAVPESGEIRRDETKLDTSGARSLTLQTRLDAGLPYSYTLEGDVEDVSRQRIANRASVTVHPAPWYVGIRRPSYFIDQRAGLSTEVVTVTPEGKAAGGVPVTVTLTQVQWLSVRRAEGNGFYTWDTERKEIPSGTWSVTTAEEPVPLDIPIPNGGYFLLEATAREEGGRYAVTRTSFYALGDGYTAWARFDHNRIELVPERRTYKPGETARIMIQSPWEQATALVTTEREGIRSHRQFTLTSTQQSITVPITEQDIPNLYVSVLLVKGRTRVERPAESPATGGPYAIEDPSDPGKPAFRLGYVELKVEDASKRLTVAVAANRDEYRPANTAKVTLSVKDRDGRGTRSEVTLWAVDYGVLSLTAYRTPDVLGSVYVNKALQVLTSDSRQRIISRRVLTPKGETDGGGGGGDAGAGTLRRDFRVLAFWLGSVITDTNGAASVDVKLPESLTTYRIMAVAADRSSRFGSGEAEVRINKPLTLAPAFPRFLAVGDTAHFGAVVTSQLPTPGPATVTIRSLDPDVLEFTSATERVLQVAANGSVEARFDAAGRRIGRARVQMSVKLGRETDAFEDMIPVEVLVSPETVAAYGEAVEGSPSATETLTIPKGVDPGFGGLHVEMSSTAMVGLGEGARYLVEYPYGCAEQRASRTIALLLAADLGDAFSLPGVDTAKMRPAVQQSLKELEKFQCPNGGFAYWPGRCQSVSAYLTSYILHVLGTAVNMKYEVSADVRRRGYDYLEGQLGGRPPVNEGWWPSYTAWQAFAVKVLVDGGRNQDSNLNRLYGYRDRMPVFALAYLHDALLARKGPAPADSAPRLADLQRRMANAILPEGGSAHVEELSDPYLLWFWNSNIRSTAIVLNTLVRAGVADTPIRQMVRWMMAARRDGRWGNTQENAHAMEALVAYYRKFESTAPDFRAVVSLGAEELAREQFTGRSTESVSREVPMPRVLATAEPGSSKALTFGREGSGTLFYTARLRYASDQLFHDGLDSGINIERTYSPFAESEQRPPSISYAAGDLVRVTLRFHLTKERRYVAVTDPLPAGFEAVESWFATTAASLAARQDDQGEAGEDWTSWWRRGGFDHVERHNDRIQLYATRLSEGTHEFTYIVRATTAGTFRTAPARAEEMYEPEVFGRTATAVIEVRR